MCVLSVCVLSVCVCVCVDEHGGFEALERVESGEKKALMFCEEIDVLAGTVEVVRKACPCICVCA